MKQPDLFGPPPVQRHSPTSIEAGATVAHITSGLRRQVFAEIARRGADGATDDEVQRALDMNPSTQRPRRIELWQAGLVIDSGRRRQTASGRKAVVWVARA